MTAPSATSRQPTDLDQLRKLESKRCIGVAAEISTTPTQPHLGPAPLWMGLAGALGWGIRGQYGHETGAMIAGVLVGFAAVLCLKSRLTSLTAARAVALTAIGIACGGSMTYGQTIGLTHDGPLIGNGPAWWWGMLGLALKGALWIGFAGLFLGLGLGGKRYRWWEMALLLVAMILLALVGMWLLNGPFDPDQRVLPRIYFSDSWHWEPAGDLKPRPECWGGLLLALLGAVGYLSLVRRDRLAGRLALWGCLAGGIGFPAGQSLQSWRAWHPERFSAEALGGLAPYLQHVNWWNLMEITFGGVFGLVLGAGLWWNRRLIVDERNDDTSPTVTLSLGWEVRLCALHVLLLVSSTFLKIPSLAWYEASGLFLGALPLVGVMAGRLWPYLMVLPLALVPIAGKTLRNLSYEHAEWTPQLGWIVLVILPLAVACEVALALTRRFQAEPRADATRCAQWGLATSTVLFTGLNFAFFRFPWPWEEWTGRTPSGLLLGICAAGLLLAVMRSALPGERPAAIR